MKIQVGIAGYGNLGRGVECAVSQHADMALAGIFTRRDPASITPLSPQVQVASIDALKDRRDAIDVLVLCGGSATDLPAQTPEFASMFNVVDSFDTHARILEHHARVDAAARSAGKVAVISVGWDPGMFSINRLYAEAILPKGEGYTFWGKGISQGHSDAIRRVPGVKDARQYTVPVEDALRAVRSGINPALTTRQKHVRVCYVVPEDGAHREDITRQIVTMPDYFADYDTTVHFISAADLARDHNGIPHGGFVIRSGVTGANGENNHVVEYSLKLDSNPEFTAAVLVAYARAAVRLNREGAVGCRTGLDIAPSYLSDKPIEELIRTLL